MQRRNLHQIKKTFFFFLLFFGFLCVIGKPVQAKDFIQTSMDVSYTVSEEGSTHVVYNLKVTNISKTHFITRYSLSLPISELNNLVIKENGKRADFQRSIEGTTTTVDIKLAKELVLSGDSTTFLIEFTTDELFDNAIYEVIHLDGSNLGNVKFNSGRLSIQKSIGEMGYSSFAPSQLNVRNDLYVITLNERDIANGFRIEFATATTYHFYMREEISNATNQQHVYSLTLPPTVDHQDVFYTKESTPPDKTFVDQDGNTIAYFYVNPSERRDINIEGYITVKNMLKGNTIPALNNPNEYVSEGKYVTISNDQVSNLISDIPSEISILETAHEINEIVKERLSWNTDFYFDEHYSRLEGGEILNASVIGSLEYADLFASLARKKNIQTRIIVGTLGGNVDGVYPGLITHAWVEVYDPSRGWVPFDPAFEELTGYTIESSLSLKHVTLGIWGLSDSQPEILLPINLTKNTNSIHFGLSPVSQLAKSEPGEIHLTAPSQSVNAVTGAFPIEILVTNNSNMLFRIEDLSISDFSIIDPLKEKNMTQVVFPYQNQKLILHVMPQSRLPLKGIKVAKISLNGTSEEHVVLNSEVTLNIHSLEVYIMSWTITIVLTTLFIIILFGRKFIRYVENVFALRSKRRYL